MDLNVGERERVGLMTGVVHQMSLDGDRFQNWSEWLEQFDAYMSVYGYDRLPETRKVAILLYFIGKPARDVFNTFGVSSRDITADCLKQRFNDHFAAHGIDVAVKRVTFFSRRQLAGEDVGRYLDDLVATSLSCDFGSLSDNIVKTKFIAGLNLKSVHLQKRLLADNKLTVCHLQALFPAEPISENGQDTSGWTQPSACTPIIKFKSRSGRRIKKPRHFDI